MKNLLSYLAIWALFVVLFYVLFATFSAIKESATPVNQLLAEDVHDEILVGEVVYVGKVWTKNGDGSFMVEFTLPKSKWLTVVYVVGSPSYGRETEMNIRVGSAWDLVGKKIEVVRDMRIIDKVVAKSIKEL